MNRLFGLVAIGVLATCAALVTGDEVKLTKGQRVETDLTSKLFPKPALPTATKTYYGRVRSILSRQKTFGFSVRDSRIPSETGFYVQNSEPNRTIIDTVLMAVEKNAEVNIHYDENTFVVEAVEVVLSY